MPARYGEALAAGPSGARVSDGPAAGSGASAQITQEADLTGRIKARARELGFDLVGVGPAAACPETEAIRSWVERGFSGEMAYIDRRVEERADPRKLLDGAESIVAVGFVYDGGERAPAQPGQGRVSRYAGGVDYHDVLLRQLRLLNDELEFLVGRPATARSYVDTGPVQERTAAARAGLGWIGKNGCLINGQLGSYLFLGVILTDIPLAFDSVEPDHCGSCTACIEACPTAAIVEPGVVDARRCISYTTIEQRGPIPAELREGQGAHLFGCDICQEVCPWNLRNRREIPADALGLRAEIAPSESWVNPALEAILDLDEEAWRRAARKTAIKRGKWRGLMRNALIAAGNSGDAGLTPKLAAFAAQEDPMLAEHARWAMERLATREEGAR